MSEKIGTTPETRPGYWVRLESHPGLEAGFYLPIIGAMAAVGNHSVPDNDWGMILLAAGFGAGFMALVVWPIILITNRDKHEQRRKESR